MASTKAPDQLIRAHIHKQTTHLMSEVAHRVRAAPLEPIHTGRSRGILIVEIKAVLGLLVTFAF